MWFLALNSMGKLLPNLITAIGLSLLGIGHLWVLVLAALTLAVLQALGTISLIDYFSPPSESAINPTNETMHTIWGFSPVVAAALCAVVFFVFFANPLVLVVTAPVGLALAIFATAYHFIAPYFCGGTEGNRPTETTELTGSRESASASSGYSSLYEVSDSQQNSYGATDSSVTTAVASLDPAPARQSSNTSPSTTK